jgi:HAMP domain-containing protein
MTHLNNNPARRALSFLVLIALLAGSVLPAFAQRRRTRRSPRLGRYTRPVQAQPNYYTVAANTVLRVRMNEEISSGNARVGDRFTTTVVDPVYARGLEVIPAGSVVAGRVTSVIKASRKSKAGALAVSFVSVQLPNGMSRSINGSLTDLNESVHSDNEGEVRGRSSTRRNVVFIGGGAATGALIGAIAGGGSGAGIGAGIGAGLGVAGAFFSKGKEAVVKRDAEFGVVLNQSVALPAAGVR